MPRPTLALLAISIVLPMLLFALAAWQNRTQVLHAAETRVERTTRILHEHALKVFETHQFMIAEINDRLRTIDWSNAADRESLHDLSERLQLGSPQVAAITILDADGNIKGSSHDTHGWESRLTVICSREPP